MKAEKFDCVEMKHQIQKQIMREMEGLSPEEQRRRTKENILSDPILGPFWRRAQRIQTGRQPAPK